MRRLCDAGAAFLWLLLTLAFLDRAGGEADLLGRLLAWALALENALAAVLFIVRRPAQRTAGPGPFLLALLVTIGPMALRPVCRTAAGFEAMGLILELLSLPWLVASLVSLGPAMGMAPADRGLRTGGTYRIVRHPLYAGELFCALGYVVGNASWRNVLLWLALLAGQFLRIRWEEELLHERYPQAYAAYCRCVRHRLLPGVF